MLQGILGLRGEKIKLMLLGTSSLIMAFLGFGSGARSFDCHENTMLRKVG